MPSPFPGMDPFLEDPDVFPGFHDQMIVHLAEFLQKRLPAPYFAKPAQRTWIEWIDRSRYPDVSVMISARKKEGEKRGNKTGALAEARSEPVTITVDELPWDEHRETFVEIYSDKGGRKKLVTAIELLSPSNKAPGEDTKEAYQRKQSELLSSDVNLVEIDLLRAGEHVTAVPEDLLIERCGEFDYHVCVHQYEKYRDFVVYPNRLSERLPEIRVPLLRGEVAVVVDLQLLFDECYDAGPYRREIDYAEDPPPPLTPQQLAWIKSVLASQPQSSAG